MKKEIEETMRRMKKTDPQFAREMAEGVVAALRSLKVDNEPEKKKKVRLKKA